MSLYTKRGVSAQKEEVHAAVQHLDQGLYNNAFCKMYPDFLTGDDNSINIMHADGAGTKSILAYLYWKETGDIEVWKGIAQDAIAMNLDDLLCAGIYTNILFSSTIDRNKSRIPGNVLEKIISGSQEFFDMLKNFGIDIHYLGGETADVGDLVRTIAVNGTMSARWPKNKVITNDGIKAGNVIVGFASSGQSIYEKTYNSGIGSNGLTSARHDVLEKMYAEKYPETFENSLNNEVVYIGKNKLTDLVDVTTSKGQEKIMMGKLLLSPTRTYAPLMKLFLENHFDKIDGAIHCSGGGQTKCMKYLPGPMKIIKDHLFEPPEIFQIIQKNSGADNREMMQVFNMGHRLEIFTDEQTAEKMIAESTAMDIPAKIIGHVEESKKKELQINFKGEKIIF